MKLVWKGAAKEECGEMEVFPRFHAVPFSKMLTFFKSEAFVVTGEYAGDVPFPSKHIGDFEICKLFRPIFHLLHYSPPQVPRTIDHFKNIHKKQSIFKVFPTLSLDLMSVSNFYVVKTINYFLF